MNPTLQRSVSKAWPSYVLIALLFLLCLYPFVISPLVYPRPSRAEVEAACTEFSVPQALVYAVMRTESGFDPAAVSHVGARGLMQLMPSTFSYLASLLGEAYGEEDIDEPAINIRLGVFYLSVLYQDLSSWDHAVMAYNAGPQAVKEWIEKGYLAPADMRIPYPETEEYYRRVKNAVGEYKRIYGGYKNE